MRKGIAVAAVLMTGALSFGSAGAASVVAADQCGAVGQVDSVQDTSETFTFSSANCPTGWGANLVKTPTLNATYRFSNGSQTQNCTWAPSAASVCTGTRPTSGNITVTMNATGGDGALILVARTANPA